MGRCVTNLNAKSNDELNDYSVLNTFLPQTEYAPQNFACIYLIHQVTTSKQKNELIAETHSIAKRLQRIAKKQRLALHLSHQLGAISHDENAGLTRKNTLKTR
jgi:hypothetical protein